MPGARTGIVTNPDGTISLPALPAPRTLTPEVLEAMTEAAHAWERLSSILQAPAPEPRVIRCGFCDKPFTPKAHNAEYCSNRCRKKAMRQREHGPRTQVARCEVCNEPLDKTKLRADATVCSMPCRIEKKNRLRRARKGTAPKPAPKVETAPKLTEEKLPEAKVKAAIDAYVREEVGLRGGAKMLGVTAPTFSEILRRTGNKVRPAPRWNKETRPTPPSKRRQAPSIRRGEPDGSLTAEREPRRAPPVTPPTRRTEPVRQSSGRTLPARSGDDDMARRAIVNVLAGGVKLPTRPAPDPLLDPEDVDQAEWDRCRSWRRMLIGLQWGKADVRALLRAFLVVVRERTHGEGATLGRAERAARGTDPAGVWEACDLAVAALREVLPDRSSIDAEIALCNLFRAKHPTAPRDPDDGDKGFASVGH